MTEYCWLAPRKTFKEDCYWYQEDHDMGARIPICKIKKGCNPIEPEDCENCEKYHSVFKRINADRVRAMSDEEIEEWYWRMHKEMMNHIDSHAFVHDWLKQESKK